jgi:MOSC domain-containing protein YiiM
MLNPASSLARLMDAPMRPGRIVWIGLRPARRAGIQVVDAAEAAVGTGLVGDRYQNKTGARQVTLIAAESLAAIAGYLGRERIDPADLRRNLVTEGINLMALKGRRFRIGAAVLEASGDCHPCSRMEETFGPGGYNAVRGLGGITARVIESGRIAIGDAVVRLDPAEAGA